ncbi:hypothetical protein [Flammeovirga sp. EKP202]|uniref:hypothetical protein n=1 Tax=Flammeovirga sp. EKP202 TaxID=2770592 RepID=UPI00165FAAD6|nr:hypothetical protein [Flammeovirga sp. EKP202]MBD0400111.1 hypothetical protein [Flammeovirga sp. EKP202]
MDQQKIFSTLERILESEVFVSSFRAKALLKYLVDNSDKGEESDFSSYTIALDVFDRDQDFDPSLDPIVRVQMGRLRVLLSKYYLQEGSNEDIIITIPRGSYKPRFSENEVIKSPNSPEKKQTTNSSFPIVHVSPLSILKNDVEQTSNYFKEVLFSRLLRTGFFKLTDKNDADFYISYFMNEHQFGINIKDKNQKGIITNTFDIDENNNTIEKLLLFAQTYLDGPYGTLKEEIETLEGFNWIKKFMDFENIILEKGWLEYVGDLINRLEKVLATTKNSFIASVLVKYYHIDFQYNLLNFPKGLERADELYAIYNKETSDFLVENIWRKIYQADYKGASKVLNKLKAIQGKHFETLVQEMLLAGYFGDEKTFFELKNKLLAFTEQLPSVCSSVEAFLILLNGEKASVELLKKLEEHLFFFNLFLLSKLSKTDDLKEKYSSSLLESVPTFKDDPIKLLSLWGHPDLIKKII